MKGADGSVSAAASFADMVPDEFYRDVFPAGIVIRNGMVLSQLCDFQ